MQTYTIYVINMEANFALHNNNYIKSYAIYIYIYVCVCVCVLQRFFLEI